MAHKFVISDWSKKDIVMWKNPSLHELELLSKKFLIRGLYHDSELYIWDANITIHAFAKELLIQYGYISKEKEIISFIMSKTPDFSDYDEWTGMIKKIPEKSLYYRAHFPIPVFSGVNIMN